MQDFICKWDVGYKQYANGMPDYLKNYLFDDGIMKILSTNLSILTQCFHFFLIRKRSPDDASLRLLLLSTNIHVV